MMKRTLTVILTLVMVLAGRAADQPAPVPFPELAHYAGLWERSLFTTRELPPINAPTGPKFTDQLSLTGIYEVDGAVVAVIVDRSTSQIIEARIGSDNEAGMRIRKVNPGTTIEKTRIELQKGDQAGWISFSDAPAAPAGAADQPAALGTRPQVRLPQPPGPAPSLSPSGDMGGPSSPLLPPLPVEALPNDVPLPPP